MLGRVCLHLFIRFGVSFFQCVRHHSDKTIKKGRNSRTFKGADTGYGFKGDITPYEDSKVAISDFKRGIVNYLLKLHGDYLHADKIVFTKEQYDICYGKNLDSPYLSFLMNVLNTKVLLFLGCSLEEDRTMKLLEKIALNHSQTHYAIVENPSDTSDDAFFDKAERLSNIK